MTPNPLHSDSSTQTTQIHDPNTESNYATLLAVTMFIVPAFLTIISTHLPLPHSRTFLPHIIIIAAIITTLIFAWILTRLPKRFRHPIGVLLQAFNWHAIITYYYYIDVYLVQRPTTSISVVVIGFVLVMVIGATVFWGVVAYRCSDEELGMYTHVQGWAEKLIGALLYVGQGFFQMIGGFAQRISQLFGRSHMSNVAALASGPAMTPPPQYSLYGTDISPYRSDIDNKV
ncbi:uncharacterized protein EDB93DRAFT_1255385 [Suillus bovinus]|uniref:uncharacterized protein n=1 Tax=Suillus bovinus TaxID=48563 RepID=UPI001B85D14D|nr:uncharacterized protein EDB93DRAFT_1255385 [Suillus bovinus]KAG2132026.1 hypothetical protein EDB93DRAFT_1255385 [Suillus bovinus]